MKLLATPSVLFGVVASVLGQTIDIGHPTPGNVLTLGKSFAAQILRPQSLTSCVEVGIALAIAHCDDSVCPEPYNLLGSVLYAGPFQPTPHTPGGSYHNFTLDVPTFLTPGPATFTLTHLCLLGGGPTPLLEYRTVPVTIDAM